MLLRRARRIGLVGLILTTLCCSLSDAQTNDVGRAKVSSKPRTGNNVPVKRAGKTEEEPPATRPKTAIREQRPEPQELRIEPLPPALEKLLQDWEAASAKITTLSGEHKRIVRNSVFGLEKWAKGEFFYESPDKGRIDLEGLNSEGAESRKKDDKGVPFKVSADVSSIWICNGNAVINIVEEKKEYEMFDIPEEMRGKNIIHGPLPFLFGMKAEEAKKRFALSFVDEKDSKKNNANVVWIKAKPRQVMDRDNFQEATIILDRKRFLPHFVQLIDPSGNVETIYEFPEKTLVVNKRNLIPKIFQNKPFEPKLAGYKRIMPTDAGLDGEGKSGVVPASRQEPQKKTDKTKSAGGTKNNTRK